MGLFIFIKVSRERARLRSWQRRERREREREICRLCTFHMEWAVFGSRTSDPSLRLKRNDFSRRFTLFIDISLSIYLSLSISLFSLPRSPACLVIRSSLTPKYDQDKRFPLHSEESQHHSHITLSPEIFSGSSDEDFSSAGISGDDDEVAFAASDFLLDFQ